MSEKICKSTFQIICEERDFFKNSIENQVSYLGHFYISFEKITFYTDILTQKVDLWIFSLMEKIPENSFSRQKNIANFFLIIY